MAEGDSFISVDYEVSGKVQGVFFRKYTQVCLLQGLEQRARLAAQRRMRLLSSGTLI